MAREVIDYEGSVFCKIVGQNVTVIRTHTVYADGDTGSPQTKILCPYFYRGAWGGNKCEKGGACGLAEGMGS